MIVYPNAKINIGLFVTGKRPDGFHDLETFFYPIGLSDMLEIVTAEGKKGECRFSQTGLEVECDVEDNLVVKAYRLLDADYHLPALSVHLHKVIPFGAGLGGGSADAAFMLKAVDAYFNLGIGTAGLEAYAARLGSDCAFFVRNRPAFAHGKGELLEEAALSLAAYRLVVVKPGFGVSTADAYRGIVPCAAGFDLRHLGGLPVEEWKGRVGNDFERTVFAKYPVLAALKQQLYAGGAVFASMTGSGSAVYGLFRREDAVKTDFPGCFVWQDGVNDERLMMND